VWPFDSSYGLETGIPAVDAVFSSLPVFLLFPQAVYYQGDGIAPLANILANPVVMIVMFLMPLILIILVIVIHLMNRRKRKAHDEAVSKYREDRAQCYEQADGCVPQL